MMNFFSKNQAKKLTREESREILIREKMVRDLENLLEEYTVREVGDDVILITPKV